MPLIEKAEHSHLLIPIVAVKLNDGGDRDRMRWMSARLRSRMYEVLFGLVNHRTVKPRIPPEFILRDRLYTVVQSVFGDDRVKSLIIQKI